MATTLAKVSGVLIITQTAGLGRYYASTAISAGKFNSNSSADGVNITIGGDSYSIPLTELTVNGQVPSTMSTAITLLNSIFGT